MSGDTFHGMPFTTVINFSEISKGKHFEIYVCVLFLILLCYATEILSHREHVTSCLTVFAKNVLLLEK